MRAVLAFATAAVAGLVISGMVWTASRGQVYTSHFDGVMGTSLDIRIQARSEWAGQQAEQAILNEIDRESTIFSSYDPASEFSRWRHAPGVATPASPELIEVLAAFDDWRGRTAGALDPAAEVVAQAWQRAAAQRRLPTASELDAAVEQVQQRHWIVDRAASTLTRTSDAPLRLNSFTKSYIVDRAARRALSVEGVRGVLLNAGGDVVVRGDWTQTIGVSDPVANTDNAAPLGVLSVHDAVVATSGGGKRGFEIEGHHYSHVVDPRTGQTTGHVVSATVVSPDAIEAGALATAFCVLTPAESAVLARSRPGVAYSLVLADGRQVESPGWRALDAGPRPRPSLGGAVATLYAEQPAWNPAWQLTVSLELARPGGMAKRPYLAVWIEDKDRFPVRTVALWYDGKARYLPEMRAWSRADRLRAMAEGSQIVDAVTSPTRQAGKYTLQWDGKDNSGKPVKAGTYTVCIEAAREHGGYQIIRQEMDFSGAPKHVALPGGTEINAAQLDYQPAGAR
jgi:thiamine biosynthesis lipoprotein ApbE